MRGRDESDGLSQGNAFLRASSSQIIYGLNNLALSEFQAGVPFPRVLGARVVALPMVDCGSPYVMVSVSTLLLPPLAQPMSPEFPPGVCTNTFKVPGAEIKPVVIVTCNS